MENQSTNVEILKILNDQVLTTLKDHSKRFDSLDASFKEIIESNAVILEAIGNYSNVVDEKFESVNTEIKDIKATLNTQVVKKSDLDDKFKEYFGEKFVAPAKRLNDKSNQIVTVLEKKKVINKNEAENIRSMEIFPRAM